MAIYLTELELNTLKFHLEAAIDELSDDRWPIPQCLTHMDYNTLNGVMKKLSAQQEVASAPSGGDF